LSNPGFIPNIYKIFIPIQIFEYNPYGTNSNFVVSENRPHIKSLIMATGSTIRYLGAMIAISALLASCSPGKPALKSSSGGVNELFIITNDTTQWAIQPGDTLRDFFGAPQTGLPQQEPFFNLYNIIDEDFSDISRRLHNIFIVQINPDSTKTMTEITEDRWASPQCVIRIIAPDLHSFYREFEQNKDHFMQLFINLERKRTLMINKLDADVELTDLVEKKFNLSLPFPVGFYIASETPDFIWLRYRRTRADLQAEIGIMIYTAEDKGDLAFSLKQIIKRRNLTTIEHVPGFAPQSYMVVAQEDFPPVLDTLTDFPGGYAVETRGLWKMQNDFMGGPFLSYTFIDSVNNKVITLDGYIYHPNEDKMGYLRQLEAIFFGLQFNSQANNHKQDSPAGWMHR